MFFFKVNKYKCKRISKHKYHLNIFFSLKRLENEGSQSIKIYRFSHGNLCSCEAYGIKPNEYCFTYTCPAYGLTCEKEFASSTPNQDQERQRLVLRQLRLDVLQTGQIYINAHRVVCANGTTVQTIGFTLYVSNYR